MKFVTNRQGLPAPAVVAVLSAAPEKHCFPAQLVEVESPWMTLQLEQPVTAGTAVRIDVQGGLVLGTTACIERGATGFRLRVEIDQIIPDTVGLERLVSAVMGRPPSTTEVFVPVPGPASTVD